MDVTGSLSHWERVAEGRVRGIVTRAGRHPHPPLRGTFSQREKEVSSRIPSPTGRGWPKAG